MTDKERNKRSDQLLPLGMKYNGESYIGHLPINLDFNVHWTDIVCTSNLEWSEVIRDLNLALDYRLCELI